MSSERRVSAVVLGLVAAVLAAMPSSSHELRKGEVAIEHPWARATLPAQENGAVYMVIRNRGAGAERLLAARTSEAQRAELHGGTATAEGVAQTRPVEALAIPSGGEARLSPGGAHVTLGGLRGQLFEGTMFPMTLVFERAGEVEVEVVSDASR